MKLSLGEIQSITNGALRVTEESDGIHFYRCTEKQIAAWHTFSDSLYNGARCTTGVRLDFVTDSKHLSFSASSGKKYELWIDGLLREKFDMSEKLASGEPMQVPLTDPLGHEKDEVRVTLWLPSHSKGVLTAVELDDGATFRPYDGYKKKILFIGDSITQGWDAAYDSLSYTHRVAAYYDASFLNQGIGGAFYHENCFDTFDFDPDLVTVAYGTNDFGRFPTYDEMRKHVKAHLSLIAEAYKDKKVFVLTPIWRDKREGKKMGTFENACAIVAEEATALGLTVIDGLTLVPPIPEFFADAYLHPNMNGFAVYAENLIRALNAHL
ncbi:MAG: SGNH/GDSL hydrolase family protein [Clostridia bacterium]|nr:SGNH/GDSL hydrolase family protein [Clostridia bacterium]